MESIEQKVIEYLKENGFMSGPDICEDNNVTEIDMHFLEMDGIVKRVAAPRDACRFPWYDLA